MAGGSKGTQEGSKKRAYELAFKIKVVNYYDEYKHTKSFSQVASHFDIPLPTVKSFWKACEKLRGHLDRRKRVRKVETSELEEELIRFIHLARSLRMPVTGSVIVTKTQSLR
eukprot:IDg7976t1